MPKFHLCVLFGACTEFKDEESMNTLHAISSLLSCCDARPRIHDRPQIDEEVAEGLEALFKILGNRTRLKMLHAIVREDEICVCHIADAVNMKPQAVSNQLQRLVDRGILGARRSGNNIYYRILDPCVVALLDYGLCIHEASVKRKTIDQTKSTLD